MKKKCWKSLSGSIPIHIYFCSWKIASDQRPFERKTEKVPKKLNEVFKITSVLAAHGLTRETS